MKRPKRGAPRALEQIDLGEGVLVHVRPPRDAFQQAEIVAAVEADMAAMLADPPEPTTRDWGFDAERIAKLAASEHLRLLVKGWMRSVVQAELMAETIEGLTEDDGVTPCAPSFDLFAALFEREALEMRFRTRVLQMTRAWDDEGNASGRGRNGASAADSTSAPAAAPSTPPAPEASPSPAQTDSESAALSTPTPPALDLALSPGGSAAQPGSGSMPASAAS